MAYDRDFRKRLERDPDFMAGVAEAMGLGRERIIQAIAASGIEATAGAFMLWIIRELDGQVMH